VKVNYNIIPKRNSMQPQRAELLHALVISFQQAWLSHSSLIDNNINAT